MRIIAGEFRGSTLFSPKGENTRPLLDRVKESLFSIWGGKLEGLRVLDLFAGTGSLGLEAISRGAIHCTFLEGDAHALESLRRNIEKFKIETRVRVLKADAISWQPKEPEQFDLFFYDPPYKLLRGSAALRTKTIQRFANLFSTLGKEEARGMFHFPRDLLDRSELANIPNLDLRNYGTSSIALGKKNP